MTLGTAESRGEKCFDQFPGERVADYKAAEAFPLPSRLRRWIVLDCAVDRWH